MEEAERIAREEHGSRKIAVISGVGSACALVQLETDVRSVRKFYARLGYTLDGPYMSKLID